MLFIFFVEWMVSNSRRPDDRMTFNRLAVYDKIIRRRRLHGLASLHVYAQFLKPCCHLGACRLAHLW
ncbi:hypothetical protein D3C87_1684150 [compost metagenome]